MVFFTATDLALSRSSFFCFASTVLAHGVVGADQQIADDGVLSIAQGGDRHHRREAAAILLDVGQLIDVLDAGCCVQRSSAATPKGRAKLN